MSAGVLRSIADNPQLPPEVQSQIALDNITFVSNDRLQSVMGQTDATPEQVAETVRVVNTEARLRALKMRFLVMALLALASTIPAGRLPDYRPGELPADMPPQPAGDNRQTTPAPSSDRYE